MASNYDSKKRFEIPKITSLNKDVKERISRRVREDLSSMQADRQEWLLRQEEFLYQWDDFINPTRRGPWAGASNLHIPVTMQQCRGFHARLYSVLFDTHPAFVAIPTDPAEYFKKDFVELLMTWVTNNLVNYNAGIKTCVDKWVWDTVTRGRGIVKLRFEEQREKFVDVIQEQELRPGPDGLPQAYPTGQEMEVEGEQIIFCGPVIDNVSILDFYTTPGYPIRTAPHVIQRLRLTKNDLMYFKKKRCMDPKAVEKLMERLPDSTRHVGPESAVQNAQDELSGINTNSPNLRNEFYRILEAYIYEDVNNDGVDERIVVWVDEDSGLFLGWNYLHRVCKDSRPPFYDIEFIHRPDTHPMGLVEMLYPLNKEIDSLHNLRIDSLTLSNVPWGTVKESRRLKSDHIQIGPGVFIPVTDHDDLMIKANGNPQAGFFREEESLIRHVETLGMSSMGFGQTPAAIGPLATATGATSMLQEMNRLISVHIDRVRRGYAELLNGIYMLCKERLPLGTVLQAIGQDGRPIFAEINDRKLFAAGVDFTFSAPTAALNKDLERQSSILWLQQASNPLWVQLGITTPATLKEAAVDVAKSLGKVNVSKYVNQPEMAPKPQSLQEEISFLLTGIMPVIVLNDDHASKIQGLAYHRDHEDLQRIAETDPNRYNLIIAAFDHVIAKHQEMLSAIEAQNQAGNLSGLQTGPTMENRRAGFPTTAESPEGQEAPVGAGAGMTPGVTGSVPAAEEVPE